MAAGGGDGIYLMDTEGSLKRRGAAAASGGVAGIAGGEGETGGTGTGPAEGRGEVGFDDVESGQIVPGEGGERQENLGPGQATRESVASIVLAGGKTAAVRPKRPERAGWWVGDQAEIGSEYYCQFIASIWTAAGFAGQRVRPGF